jgi:hypothetical protein
VNVGTDKPDRSADIRVALSEFDKDPERYMRLASIERRVFVYHDGWQSLFACFGGSLDASPTDDDE